MGNRFLYPVTIACLVALVSSGLSARAQMDIAQRPHDDWQEIQTLHFRVYFSPEMQPWAESVIPKMESIHAAVTSGVGYDETGGLLDIVIMDPLGVPNGMALPYLGSPRIILWPNAPVNPLMMGGLETWSEIVMTHELVHAIHLTREPRNLKDKLLRKLLPLGPLALKLPPWMTEGYAVMLESDLTGYGRVNSSVRSMLLSQLGTEGRLPSFSELSGSDHWLGGRFPYLVGSAYLQWLKNRSGDPDCLQKLWKRTGSRSGRSFEEAFSGVFRDSPEKMYRRFVAELTAEAMRLEQYLTAEGGVVEGTTWQYLEGMTGEPAVSPDNRSMAVVTHSPKKPAKLVVWSLTETAEQKPDPAEDDPDDVPALPVHPPKRKLLFSFPARNGIQPAGIRWAPDGNSIFFHAARRMADGDLRNDLFRWYPQIGTLERLTEGSGFSWPDPDPDGRHVAALRQIHGFSNLVLIDLMDGSIENLTEPSLDIVWQNPRFSPDGKYLAAIRRTGNRCELIVLDVKTRSLAVWPTEPREVILHPAWLPDGSGLLFCSDRSGIVNIEKLTYPDLKRSRITSSIAGLISPEPARNGSEGFYCLKPHAEGININFCDKLEPLRSIPGNTPFSFVLPPASQTPVVPLFEISPIAPPEPYQPFRRIGVDWTAGATQLPYQSSFQAGLRADDLLGRFQMLMLGGVDDHGGTRGGLLGIGWKRFPVHLKFEGFYNHEDPADQKSLNGYPVFLPELDAAGLDLTASWKRFGSMWMMTAEGGSGWSNCRLDQNERFDRALAAVASSFRISGNRGEWGYGLKSRFSGRIGRTGSDAWTQIDWSLKGFTGWKSARLLLGAEGGNTGGTPGPLDLFTIGGGTNALQSEWFLASRKQALWLPVACRSGEKYSRFDVELLLGNDFPFVLYGSEIAAWHPFRKETQRAVGCEWRLDLPHLPVFRIAPVSATAGVAYGLEGDQENKWRGYLALDVHL